MKYLKLLPGILFTFCFIYLYGCSSLKEDVRGFTGVSTKILEDDRENGMKITFKHDYNSCYRKIMDVLVLNKCYVYANDPRKDMIAIYVSEEDTTPVGIFLKTIDGNTTLIEITSPSTYTKETISKVVFSAFDKEPLVLTQKKGQLEVKKMLGH